MWQTPVSKVSPANSTPLASSSARVAATSSHPSPWVALLDDVRHPHLLGLPDAEARIAGPLLIGFVLVGAKAKRVAVEAAGAVGVLGGDADEVESGDHGGGISRCG